MNESETTRWRHAGSCVEGQPFEIDGVNVWDHEWHPVPGVFAKWREPLHGQECQFEACEIRLGTRTIRFGAGEYSANVYLFALPVQTDQ